MDKLNQNRNISSEEFKKIKRQFDNLNKQRSKDFTFLKELGKVINKMSKKEIEEFVKNYNNLFLQTVDLLKRNPSLYFTIQSVLSAQVSDKLVSSSKKDG